MQTTDLFREALKKNAAITWKDIFSNSFKKHSQVDRDRALQVGTQLRVIPEDQFLHTWHRPWLWWPVAKYGIGLVVLLYAVMYLCLFFFGTVAEAIFHMVMIIPPIVIPFIIMVFLWELNVPQDISMLNLLAYFFIGGLISFLINTIMFLPIPDDLPAYFAAVREEPAKLGASILILLYIQKVKKKKIYGFTGLVVGAAVGAAFSGIESVSYAINNSGSIGGMVQVQIMRALLAMGGHITYCVPYATAIALSNKNHRLELSSFCNPLVILSFLFSIALHALWNGSGILVELGIVVASFFILLYWVKACFRDIARVCAVGGFASPRPGAPAAPAETLAIYCKNGPLAGMQWRCSGGAMVIGRQRGVCAICYPETVPGISRQHCRILQYGGQWCLQDLDSSCGTYMDGIKLIPNQMYPLRRGANIYLGSKQIWLTVV